MLLHWLCCLVNQAKENNVELGMKNAATGNLSPEETPLLQNDKVTGITVFFKF